MIRPFADSDLFRINLREFEKKYRAQNEELFIKKHLFCAHHGHAFTMEIDSAVIAIGGIIELWEGVAEAWLLTSEEITGHSKVFHKTTRQMMERLVSELHLHRIQSVCDADNFQSIRWHEAIGFAQEGTLRQYGPDKSDFIMMAKVM